MIEPVEDYFNRIDGELCVLCSYLGFALFPWLTKPLITDLLVPMDITKFIMWGLGQPEQFYEEGSGEGICKCLASRCSWTSVLGRNVFHLDLTLQPLFVFRGFGCSRIGVDRATESRAHEIQACDVNSSHRISG